MVQERSDKALHATHSRCSRACERWHQAALVGEKADWGRRMR